MIISVKTGSKTEFVDVTARVQEAIRSHGVENGLCVLYVPHTTGAVTINEAADPSVKEDILMILNRIVPWQAEYRHLEGNSPAHVKATLVGASQTIPIESGRLALGTWQGVYLWEHRTAPHRRRIALHLLGA